MNSFFDYLMTKGLKFTFRRQKNIFVLPLATANFGEKYN